MTNAQVTALIAKLENDYDFQCEAGPLKNCVDWQQVRDSLLALAFDKDTGEKYIERAAISEELRKELQVRLSEVERERDDEHNALHDQIGHTFDAEARARIAHARLSEVEKALEEAHAAIAQFTSPKWVVSECMDDKGKAAVWNGAFAQLRIAREHARAALQHKDQQG